MHPVPSRRSGRNASRNQTEPVGPSRGGFGPKARSRPSEATSGLSRAGIVVAPRGTEEHGRPRFSRQSPRRRSLLQADSFAVGHLADVGGGGLELLVRVEVFDHQRQVRVETGQLADVRAQVHAALAGRAFVQVHQLAAGRLHRHVLDVATDDVRAEDANGPQQQAAGVVEPLGRADEVDRVEVHGEPGPIDGFDQVEVFIG